MTMWADSLAEYTEAETEADQEALTAPTKGSERSSQRYAAAMGRRADEAAEQVQRWAIATQKGTPAHG